MSHDRTASHTGLELDDVIELAEALPSLSATELDAALAEIDRRLGHLEGAPRFSLDAVIS